ncbi:MAG TPA: tetratricopeptide repeat protein [Spirochaetales bacterium]|nr:tetratricopeptide repeat protein [Spirochaetales bacterium]HPB65752.1 tetratricopeptide repeat protein [Spirochaetales bacterium]HPG85694.1 tetratricopeptide repeat protein [Spirochaetales bacterium]
MNTDESPRLPGNIAFIRIPEGMARPIGSFTVDPSIPIPVELGQGAPDLSDLSWEMIVAGMLRLLAYDPDNPDGAYYRAFVTAVKPELFAELSEAGILKARNGDLEVAEEIFKALAGLSPEAPEPTLNLAILYEDKADALDRSGKEELADAMRSRAFEAYKRLLAMEPAYPDAFFNAGLFYLKNREYGQAARLFESYAAMGDDEAKLSKAREVLSKLRVRGDADAKFKEAYDFIRMGREEEGIERAMEFNRGNDGVWNGWFLVGWGHRRLGRYEDGRAAFLRALELGADEVDLLNELAICEMELGMLSESRGRLERALRKEPENIKIISNLGVVARRQGRDEEAAGFFRIVLEMEPGDALARAQLDELTSA